jgi:hypothetical protein
MVKLRWATAIVSLLVSPPGVGAQTLDELITQAKKEPELVFVAGASTFGGRQAFAELQSAFNKRFGLNARINFSAGPSMPAMALDHLGSKSGHEILDRRSPGSAVTRVELRNEGSWASQLFEYSLG